MCHLRSKIRAQKVMTYIKGYRSEMCGPADLLSLSRSRLVGEPTAGRFPLNENCPLNLHRRPLRVSQNKYPSSTLKNAFFPSHLIGWTARPATSPEPFLCPSAGQPALHRMTDAQISREQWLHTSNHLPQTLPPEGDNSDPR